MYGKKLLSKLVIASVLVGGLNFVPVILNSNSANLQMTSVAYAEIKDVTAKDAAILDFADESAEYTAKVQNIAKMRAIQRARERAGVYLKSFSRTVNGVLTANDISAYTSDKIEVSDVKFQKLFYQVKDVNGNLTGKIGFMYEATVTAKIDTTGLQEYIQKSLQEKQRLIDRDKNLQKNIEEVNKKYEDLRQNAKNKTPEQIKSELEQINKKIEETEKISAEQTAPMIFSQPIKIGHAGHYKDTDEGGFIFKGTSYNDGDIISGSDNKYGKGLARWGNGKDALYCEYDYYLNSNRDDRLKFGGKNNFLVKEMTGRDILKIESNEGLTIYVLYRQFMYFAYLDIIGCRPDGTWVKYINFKQLEKQFFEELSKKYMIDLAYGNHGNKLEYYYDGNFIYTKNDTIIVLYSLWKGWDRLQKGEFRFKWDEKAQWFGVEQVVYK